MIVPLKDAGDIKKFGGKASNLAKLLSHDLNVPDGWAVSHDSFDINGALQGAESLTLTRDKVYAVRSSATVEDSGDKSWAGQFETFLFVKPADVIGKIEECHASSNARTKAYAAEAGKTTDFHVAVVVQEMVDPKFAGVLFTKNPVSGANELVIEYVAGIGEKLVSGEVIPEHFSWDREAAQLVTDHEVPFAADTLAKSALQVEDVYYGEPQDIEWAVDASNKLWLLQTRPITTLNVAHTGKGHHYLGDPESLFYWGPASARPLYMSDFLAAEQANFKHIYQSKIYPKPPKTVFLFHDNKSLWLNKKKAFVKFAEAIFTVYVAQGDLQKDIADWHEAIALIDATKTYEPKALLDLLVAAWRPTLIAEVALYGAEGVIAEELKNYSQEDRRHIWGGFSLPDEPTFINKIDQDVLKLQDPEALAKKYPWSLSSYAGVGKAESLKKYYTQRIKDLQENSEVFVGSATERAKIVKQFKLSKEVVKQLDLARQIAEFMDDRKAWMMQSRAVIQKMVQAFAVKTGVDILHLEKCRLADLAKGVTEEYYGWTYVAGGNIKLKKEDVARAWQWYVEYRAASSVLQGIVSSRGGKHFLAGEVVVVHDPSEQIPEDKIVVVPSTSPSFVPIMRRAAALITDHGGMMSHAAIVAREFNLPCIVGTVNATKVLKTGDHVVLDLVNGVISK